MGGRAVDLFDDPPWSTDVAAIDRGVESARPLLGISLGLVVALMASMALGWFHSGEVEPLSPFSHWLDHGWAPGTQKWAFLVLGLALASALAIGLVLRRPSRARTAVLPVLASALVIAVALETIAHPAINPGPNLRATYGAWMGDALAAVNWCAVAVATLFSAADRHEERRRGWPRWSAPASDGRSPRGRS